MKSHLLSKTGHTISLKLTSLSTTIKQQSSSYSNKANNSSSLENVKGEESSRVRAGNKASLPLSFAPRLTLKDSRKRPAASSSADASEPKSVKKRKSITTGSDDDFDFGDNECIVDLEKKPSVETKSNSKNSASCSSSACIVIDDDSNN